VNLSKKKWLDNRRILKPLNARPSRHSETL
jgi:hypothetical protein